YCATSRVYHVGGGSLKKEDPYKTYLNFRNNLMMLQKNLPGIKAYYIIFIRLWLDLLAMINFVLTNRVKDALAVHKAHWHFFRFFNKNAEKRRQLASYPSRHGIYKHSLVWDYFIRGRRKFSDLKAKRFT